MPIRLLADEVASQIAAGEVVERPTSVVKELIENAIDSKASHIVIQVEGGGQRLVEVTDDGCGISASELPLALTRHATSKLARVEDLFNIHTLGFRGEALASIGSVSRLMITSRTAQSDLGGHLKVDGGSVSAVTPAGAPVGTAVRVEDLFYNVPARLKFLKNPSTERRIIDTLVARFALAFPDIRFQLSQEGRISLQTSGNGDRREVLGVLFGAEIARQMLEVLAVEDPYQITGYISPISLTRSNRRDITFYINRRSVQDVSLASALIQAYHTLLMVGRYPVGVLFIDVPSEMVDVNVHPTKAEVRFRQPEALFSGVQRCVRRALLAHTPVPQIENPPYLKPTGWEPRPETEGFRWAYRGEDDYPAQMGAAGPQSTPQATQSALTPPTGRMPLLRLVGQVALAFIIAEGPDGLYLIDQHAAHERVLFEKLITEIKHSDQDHARLPSQTLLSPVTVEMPPNKSRLLEGQIPVISRLGFQVEEFGMNTYLIRAVPALLSGMDPAAALYVLVEDFEEDETPLQVELEARIIARVCKRAAVKAGKVLSNEEQRVLLADLEACHSPRTCPHGRPTMIHLSVDLLERQFGRKGA
jgi:DNA mismatch repair protein MutL